MASPLPVQQEETWHYSVLIFFCCLLQHLFLLSLICNSADVSRITHKETDSGSPSCTYPGIHRAQLCSHKPKLTCYHQPACRLHTPEVLHLLAQESSVALLSRATAWLHSRTPARLPVLQPTVPSNTALGLFWCTLYPSWVQESTPWERYKVDHLQGSAGSCFSASNGSEWILSCN